MDLPLSLGARLGRPNRIVTLRLYLVRTMRPPEILVQLGQVGILVLGSSARWDVAALFLSIFSIAVSEGAGEPRARYAQHASSRRRRVCYHVGSIGELITFHSDKGGAGHRKIQRVITGRIRCCAPWSNSGGMAGAVCIVLLSLFLEGCARPSVQEPITLTLLEEWTTKTFHEGRQQELQQFTRETGIRVKLLPSPESAREKLGLWQELL